MRKKNIIVTFLLVLGIISITLGVSVAFFNYTRTGNINTVATGKIYFNTTQDGNISLTNIFPMSSEEIDNVLETGNNVTINIEGDTSYDKGVEYLVTAEDVNIEVNEKKIPLNLYITSTNNLGNNDDNYFDNRGSDTSLYKVLSGGVVYDGQYLLVGYIAPGQEGIEGNLNIKAYIDKDKIAITDTPEENIEWQRGRTVFSTSEWNSLNASGTPLSFKIRVEANEGVWVDPYTTPNLMYGVNINRNAVNIKEIRFIHETPLRMQRRYDASVGEESNGTKMDLTYQDTGKVLAWIEPVSVSPTGTNNELLNVKPKFLFDEVQEQTDVEQIDNETSYVLYIASSGETKWVTGQSLFGGFTSVEKIVFDNVDSSDVTTMSGMFAGMSNLKSIERLNKLDTSNVTNMSGMFNGDTSLTSIDLSGLGSNVLSTTSSMFGGCTNLEEINMSNFNFGTMTTLYEGTGLFQNLTKLTNINLSWVKMDNVAIMSNLFYGCTSLTSVDLSGSGSSNLVYISSMFYNCNALTEILMYNFNFGHVNFNQSYNNHTNYYYAFAYLPNVETIDLTNANTSGVTNMYDMFYNCKKLKNIIGINTLDTSNVTDMQYMFSECDALTSVDLSNLNINKVTNMESMFYGCDNLENVIMHGNGRGAIVNISSMFSNCPKLTSIDLSGLGGDNLNSYDSMLYNCNSLKNINMSNFNFGKINSFTDSSSIFSPLKNVLETINLSSANFSGPNIASSSFYYMFDGFSLLRSVNLSNANTSKVTSMQRMFANCSNLISVDFTGIDTSNVTNLMYMFSRTTSLTMIDLSAFDTNSFVNIEGIFSYDPKLTTIYVGNNWNMSNCESSNMMFSGCTSLVGGNGTSFDSTKTDKTMAVIDTPTTPGYLTLKG